MFQHYLAALLGLRQAQELACPAPPDTRPAPAGKGPRSGIRAHAAVGGRPRTTAMAAWPCAWSCSPSSTRELDAWEAEHGWLYR